MNEAKSEIYRVLFFGEVAAGTDREQAASFLANRLDINAQTLAKVMSGRKVALRSNLDQASAFALQSELENAGLITRIEAKPTPSDKAEAQAESNDTQAIETSTTSLSPPGEREKRVQMSATRLPMPPPVDDPDNPQQEVEKTSSAGAKNAHLECSAASSNKVVIP